MSEEEKKIAEQSKPITPDSLSGLWQRAKKAVILYDIIKVFVIVGGVLIGEAVILENKIAEVLATPKRTTALEVRDSIQFIKSDSSLNKHNGYFTTIFHYIDTSIHTSDIRYTRK